MRHRATLVGAAAARACDVRSPGLACFHPPSHTWSHVVFDPHGGDAGIIDPVLDFDPVAGRVTHASVQALWDEVCAHAGTLRWILETHVHADHLSGAQWLKARAPQATLAICAGIRDVQRTFASVFNLGSDFAVDGSQFDHLFEDDERFAPGAVSARVIATPGHTSDSVSYLIGDALFTGDSLFMPDDGTARCDFPGGDAPQLFRSIQRLYALPDATRVFVCHDYLPGGRSAACESTIGEQKRGNIHVRSDQREEAYVKLRRERDATLSLPQLLLPAVQVNIRGGRLPRAEGNGVSYLKIPLDTR